MEIMTIPEVRSPESPLKALGFKSKKGSAT